VKGRPSEQRHGEAARGARDGGEVENDAMPSFELVLFDIDGTLIDTGGAGARSWTWAFEHAFDRPGVDIGKYSSAGMTDPVVARKTFTEAIGREPTGEELTRLIAAYLSVLPDYVTASEGYRVLPGVNELLPRLHDAGVLLGVTTGAMEAGAHAKLGRARLNHFFLVGGYGSDSADRVELTTAAVKRGERLLGRSLDPREVAVVGDTPLDISAAQDAGVVSVGVATGKYDLNELRAANPDYALSSLAEPFPGLDN
jgi:phosphoglycolate phosphatase